MPQRSSGRRWFNWCRNIFLLAVACVLVLNAFLLSPVLFSSSSAGRQCPAFTQPVEPVAVTPDRFDNNALSQHRPRNQYCRPTLTTKPLLTVITSTYNPRDTLLQTRDFLFAQSFTRFKWIIVDDHSTDADAIARMAEVSRHPQVTLLHNTGKPGLPHGRNFALPHIDTEFVLFLDDDDYMELTAFEKCAWALASNPNFDLCGFYMMCYGSRNYTFSPSFLDSDFLFWKENRVVGSSMVRASAIKGITYSPLEQGMEDWDFWQKMFEHGSWGYTVPERFVWYRNNPDAFRKERWPSLFQNFVAAVDYLRNVHSSLEDNLPRKHPRPNTGSEPVGWQPLLGTSLLHPPDQRTILMVVPRAARDDLGMYTLRAIEALAQDGWKVTVVITTKKDDASVELQPFFMQFTHDVFILPHFLRLADYGKFVAHLIHSRGIGVVWTQQAQWLFWVLPSLKPQFPNVRFVCTVRTAADVQLCATVRSHLDLTIGPPALAKQAVRSGLPAGKVLRLRLPVLLPTWQEVSAHRSEHGGLRVISYVAPLEASSRPLLAVSALLGGIRRAGFLPGDGGYSVTLAGEGSLRMQVQEEVSAHQYASAVSIMGTTQATVLENVVAESALYVHVASEELESPVAVAQAMAHGVPIIACDQPGIREMLGIAAVSLVQTTGDDESDARLFQAAIAAFLGLQPSQRRQWSAKVYRRATSLFSTDATMAPLLAAMQEQWGVFSQSYGPQYVPIAEPDPVLAMAHQLAVDQLSDVVKLNQLDQPRRTGLGAKLQSRCGETNPDTSMWIDGVIAAKPCDPALPVDGDALFRSAKHGCGHWCLKHVDKPGSGWVFQGQCWIPGVVDDDPKYELCWAMWT